MFFTLSSWSCTHKSDASALKSAKDDEIIQAIASDFFQPEQAFSKNGIGVSRSPGGAIYLYASNCERISQNLESFVELRKKWEPDFAGLKESLQPKKRPSGWCEVKLDKVLPPLVANTFGKEIDDNSIEINCWSHALALVGVMPGLAVASAETFTFAMESSQ